MIELGVRHARDLEHLEPPSVAQLADPHWVLRRDVSVEAGREAEVVLGLVEDPGRRVDVDGLMCESARRADRIKLDVLARTPVDRHLEHVAVPPLQQPVVRPREVGPHVRAVDGLLAREPSAPRGRAAGAVHLGAVAADP
jgi:hypothetical protein